MPASARNKSENSLDAEPRVVPSALTGRMDVPKVPVLITGLVSVLFVNVSVDIKDTKVELPLLGVTWCLLLLHCEAVMLPFDRDCYFHS